MSSQKRAWVAATLDTKMDEAMYVCSLLEAVGLPVTVADLDEKGVLKLSAGRKRHALVRPV